MNTYCEALEERMMLSAVAVDDQLTVGPSSQMVSIVIDPLANDSTTHSPLQIVSFTQPTVGSVSLVQGNIESGGSVSDRLVYNRPANYTGSAGFSYTIEDSSHHQDAGQITVTTPVGNIVDLPFGSLTGWTVVESGGDTDEGSVVVDNGDLLLEEGDSFLVSLERNIVIPANPGSLSFEYDATFDTTDTSSINDAFEVALVDSQGRPVVPIVRAGRDSFLNETEQEVTVHGSSTTVAGQKVSLDISSLPVGGTYHLSFRLVNNDSDTGTKVRLVSTNHLPVATLDAYTTTKNVPITKNAASGVLANDTDADQDTLRAELISGPSNGTLTLNANGSFTYTPVSTFVGTDTFTYVAVETVSGKASLPATVSIQVGPDSYEIPGEPGTLTVLTLSIEAVNIEASYRNELGMYLVDNAQGAVNGILPGQAGYVQAALNSPTRQIVFARPADNEDLIGQVYQVVLPAGTRIAFYLVQNQTTANLLQNNPNNSVSGTPLGFFSFGAADPDSFQHFRHSVTTSGDTYYEVEDLTGGGDQDYNDLQFSVSATPTEVVGPVKFFVADASTDRVYEYNPTGYWVGQPQLNASNNESRGITSNMTGSKRWVVNANGHVYAYDDEMTLLGHWQASGITSASGIGTNGTDIWIVDNSADKVYFFSGGAALTTGTISPTSNFSLNAQNSNASDLATNGTKIWVTDNTQDRIYVYNTSGTLQGSWQLDAANGDATGVTYDPTGGSDDLWVVDKADRVVYRYAHGTTRTTGSGNIAATDTFALATPNIAPEGIADPLAITVDTSATNGVADANGNVLISGQAVSDSGTVTHVTINGVEVDVLDAAGNFFAEVPVQPGTNTYNIASQDSASQTATAVATVNGASVAGGGIDFSVVLPAVSQGIVGEYGMTSFNDRTDILYADVALRNLGTFAVSGPLLVGVRNITSPRVTVALADGWTPGPNGIPYYDFSQLIGPDGILSPGELSAELALAFHNPDRVQFEYELVIFGAVNHAPQFTTTPVINTIVGGDYVYDSGATDIDGDDLTYSLLSAPDGLAIDSESGELTWSPDAGDEGKHAVSIRVDDGRGGVDIQNFVISVTDDIPNRPPRFTSTPVIDAYVNVEYDYPSVATDPDQDDLTYSLVDGPDGMEIDDETGEIIWTPPAALVGQTVQVTIQADDGNGASGGGIAQQTYLVYVHPQPGNAPPVIISNPSTTHVVPGFPGTSTGNVSPTRIDLELEDGVTSVQTVTITLPEPGGAYASYADIIFVVDESGSMMEQSWIAILVEDLEEALTAAGIGTTVGYANRYGLVGFGAANPVPRSILLGTTNALFGTSDDVVNAVSQLQVSGGEEDGYAAVDFALDYPFRSGAARNIILVTDEDRDDLGSDGDPTYEDIVDELEENNALLNVVVSASFSMPVPPVARLTGTSALSVSGTATLNASGSSDPDGGTIASYSWDLNGDGTFGDGGYTSSSLSLSWSTLIGFGFDPGESNLVAVRVTDNEGETDIAKFAINVGVTSVPIASLSGTSQIPVFSSLSLYASGSDPDGGSLVSYTWDLNGDGTFGDGGYTTTSVSLNWTQLSSYGFVANDSRTVAVRITDNEGETDVAKYTVNVGPLSGPIASLSGTTQIAAYSSLSLYASGTDPDGGSIASYSWDLNGDGIFGDGSYTSSSITPSWATLVSFGFVPGGMHTVAVRVTDNEGDTDVAKYTINIGVLSSPIASLSGTSQIAANSGVSLYASGTDPDGGSMAAYSWDLNGDGTFGDGSYTGSSISPTWANLVSYGFAAGGSYTVAVRVTDDEGATDIAKYVVNVGVLSAPIASLSGTSQIAANSGVSLYASGSDPDGGSMTAYSWDLNGDGTFGDGGYTGSSISPTWANLVSYGFAAGGSYTVSVRVTDDEGATDVAKYVVNVGVLSAPIAGLSGTSQIAANTGVSLYASGSDPDGGSITAYSWDLNGDGTFGDGSYTGSSISPTWANLVSYGFAAGGSYTVAVRITDDEGATDIAKYVVNVGVLSAPIAGLSGTSQIAANSGVTLSASGSDPDGGSIAAYSWDLNGDGTFGDGSYTGSSISPTWANLVSYGFAAGGSYTVSVRVTDDEGATDIAKFVVNVGQLSNPIASLSSSTSMSVNNSLSLSAGGSDPDGGSIASYSWDLNGDGTFGDGSYTNSNLNLSWSTLAGFGFAAGGMHTVAVQVTDDEGVTDIAKWSVNVNDTSPLVVAAFNTMGSNSAINAFSTLSLNASSSNDPDGGALVGYTWDLNGDGTFGDGSYTSSSLSLSWSTLASFGFVAGGSHVVTVKVTDNEGDTDMAKWAVNVGPASLPIAQFDMMTPTSMSVFGSINVGASNSTDPDGGSIAAYTWDLNGDGTFGDGGYTSSSLSLNWTTLSSFGFVANGNHTIGVKVTDNEGDVDTAKWVINVGPTSLPIAQFDMMTPTSMSVFGSINVGASNSTDPDGGSIAAYTWDLNGDGTFGDGGYTSSSLSLNWTTLSSFGFVADANRTIAVKVTDNEGDVDTAKWVINVGPTSLPIAQFDMMTPTSMSVFGSINVGASNSTDPDGGSIAAYTWDLNGDGTFGDGGYTSSSLSLNWTTLSSFGFVANGNHTIGVKVTDNEGDVDTAKWVINVGPTSLPIAQFDMMTPTSMSAFNSVNVGASNSTDPDGGSISAYTWDLNGDGTFGDGGYTSSSLNLSWATLSSFGFVANGSHTIGVKVTDNEGDVDTAKWVINVGPASLPIAQFDMMSSTSISAFNSASLSASSSTDPDGGSISTYTWDLNGDGTFGDGGYNTSYLNLTWSTLAGFGFVPNGSHTVAVKVTDNEGDTDIAKWTVNVGPESPPLAQFDMMSSTSISAFNSASLSASSSTDPDGGSITNYTWDLNGDGTFGDGGYTASYLTLTWSTLAAFGFVPSGSHTVAVKVTDNEGATDIAKWTVNVGPESLPIAKFDEMMAPSSITPGTTLNLYASSSSDPDGGSITGYTWDLNNDGVFGDGSYTTSNLNLSWATLEGLGYIVGGSYPITVKVTDNEGQTDTAIWVVNVDRNATTAALGVDWEGIAYGADGSGGFSSATGGAFVFGSENTKADYVDMAWEVGGAAWDITLLRQGGQTAVSFTAAFVEVKKSEILHQIEEIDIDVVASNETDLFENLTGIIHSAELGTEVEFEIAITSNGAGQAYEVQFVQAGTGVVLGSIPVTVNNDYFYLVQAVDPDGDPLTYSLVVAPDGAEMDPETARITWEPAEAGEYEFKVRVTDGHGGFDEQDFIVTVTDSNSGNDAPTIDAIPDYEGQVGRAFEHQVVANDPDGDTLRYYLTDAPDGMTINVDTGLISWTPVEGQQNAQHTVTVKVFDRRGGSDTETFDVDVAPAAVFVNTRPEITSTATLAAVTGVDYYYLATAFDADGDDLTWSLTLGPDGAGVDPETGAIVWTPHYDQVGSFPFAVQVRDSHGGTAYQYFVVEVASWNDSPAITSQPTGPASQGEAWTYQVVATDPNGDVLEYILNPSSVVGDMAIDASTGLLTWTPGALGQYRIEIIVVDNRGGYDLQSFTLAVTSNAAPRITTEPTGVATVGEVYSYTIGVTDADGDAYTIALDADSIARGIELTGNELTWTPLTRGDFPIVITVTDVHGAWVTQSFTLPVRPAVVESAPPVITSRPVGPAYVGHTWTYVVTAIDPDDDEEDLVYTLESPTSNPQVNWNATTRTLTWTPLSGDVATGRSFSVLVTDLAGSSSRQTFTVPAETIAPSGAPPRITSIPTGPAIIHQQYQYQVEAYDPNGQTLTYSLVSPPPLVEIDPETGLLTYTPGSTGSVTIQIRVDDNVDGYATQSFTLPVINAPTPSSNLPPEITSRPSGPAYVGQAWTYVVEATDLDGDEADIVYSLVTPTGNGQVNFNPTTRKLTWTPLSTGSLTFTIRAADGAGDWVEQTFTIPAQSTAPTNVAPRIRSIPPNPVRIGDIYAYQVDAYDPNGDKLAYALQSAPIGMSIDPETGFVSWQPSAIGQHTVTIAVTDGISSPVLQTFTLDAIAPVKLNEPPHIISQPTGPAVRDREYRYLAQATDPDGDTITWSIDQASIDLGITINSTTGLLEWTPSLSGTFEIKVKAEDSHLASETQTFGLVVLQNAPPVITSTADTQVDLGQDYAYNVNAVDPNAGDTLTYSLADAPEGMTIDEDTGEIEWTPSVAGVYGVTVVVADQDGAQGAQSYQLRVTSTANTPPVIHSTVRDQIQVGQQLIHQVDATDADGDTLTYSLVGAPDGMTIDNGGLINWTPGANQASTTPHTFTLKVNDGRTGGLVQEVYSITVSNQLINHAPSFTTEPRTNLVAGTRYTYDADATDPDGDTLIYSLVTAPSGMTINPLTGQVVWTPSVDNIGTHTMKVRVVDTLGQGVEQTVTLTVRAVNRPPMFNGDPPTIAIRNEQLVYQVQASDPDGHRLTYALGNGTTASGSIAINSTTGVITWTPNTTGAQFIQVNVFDELGMGIAVTFRVEVLATRPNNAPTITNAPGLEASINSTYSWNADATDPDVGDTVAFQLTSYSVPGGSVTFNTTSGLLQWSVPNTAGLIGQYGTFEVRAVDSLGAYQSRRFSVLITAVNVAPVIDTIPNQTVSAGAVYRFDVEAADANNDPLTYSLDSASIARGMAIDQYGRISWTPDQSDISGTPYTVTVTVKDDRGLTDTDDYTLLVTADVTDPTVTIVRDRTTAPIGTELNLNVHAIDDVGVVSRTLTLVSVTFNSVTTTLNLSIPVAADGKAHLTLAEAYVGTLTFAATATDAAGNVGHATNVTVSVFDPSDVNPPTVAILSPNANGVITEPVNIIATIADDLPGLSWIVRAIPLDGGDIRTIATGSGPVTNASVALFDPTLLRNGTWKIEIAATDQGSHTTISTRTVEVDGGLKLGNFTVSFIDLKIPVAGIPLTVTRTYDTLNSDVEGDFGYGWQLTLSNTKVKVDLGDSQDPGLFGYEPFKLGTRVIITLPDGTKQGFTFSPKPLSSGFITLPDMTPRFIPDYGVTSELLVDQRYIRKLGDTYIDMETGRDYTPADPVLGGAYTLKLRNGTELAINAESGDLSQIIDLNGNVITFSGMGIEHSSGRSIQFERDFANRISAVIDPNGNRIEYQYDPNGNLLAVTDRAGSTTQFTYLNGINDPEHYLDQIIDPYGHPVAKNEYDASGRLSRVTDGAGKTIEYVWDAGTRIQRVTDQLGNVFVIETDARGNVTRETDPLGKTISRTYDSADRQLTETIVVDDLDSGANGENNDLTTTFVYNANGDLIDTIEPRGQHSRVTYNEHGQPTSSTDSLGNTSFNDYGQQGFLARTRNAIGNVTSFSYDTKGNMTSVRDDNGNTLVVNTNNSYGDVTSAAPAYGPTSYFDYDINGNQVASWTFNGAGPDQVQLLNVTYYDESNRVVGNKVAILPFGHFVTQNLATTPIPSQYVTRSSSTEYSISGQISATVDQYGLRTEYTYDYRGLQIQSRIQARDSDGNLLWLVTRTVFDAAGRAIASTDQYSEGTSDPIQGALTTYDAVGRVVSTSQVLGLKVGISGAGSVKESSLIDPGTTIAAMTTTYDVLGRIVATVDMYGLHSETTFNSQGDVVQTRTEVVNELGEKVWMLSRLLLDSQGRVKLATDPYLEDAVTPVFGTETVYDQFGRTVRTFRRANIVVDLDDGETVLISAGTELWHTETVYDSEGRAYRTISATGHISETIYDSFGRQVASLGHPQSLTDVGLENHPLASASNPAITVQLRSETQYDALGRAYRMRTNIRQFTRADGTITIDDSAAQTLTYEFDARGNQTKATFTDGSFVAATFDDLGRKTSETNQLGQVRNFTYDLQGRLIAVELPGVLNPATGQIERAKYQYGYDAEGRQISLTDPLGRETSWSYDGNGQEAERTLPLGFGPDGTAGTSDDSTVSPGDWVERTEYDNMGRPVLLISFEGVVTENHYNDYGQLSEQHFYSNLASYDDGEGVATDVWTFTKDAFDRPFKMTRLTLDSSGNITTTLTTTYLYDDEGRLTEVTSPEGTVSYTYDKYGRKTSSSIGTAASPTHVTTYTYDSVGRLDTVTEDRIPASTSDALLETSYHYDLMGNLDRTDLPNGVIEDYEYDTLNRLEAVTQYAGDSTPEDLSDNSKLAEFIYTLRADGRRTASTETIWTSIGAVTNAYTWTYDNLNRLVEEKLNSSADALDFTATYVIDLVGNRLSKTVDYGNDTVVDESVSYNYDANDRLVREASDKTGTANDSTTFYAYDHTQQTAKSVYAGLHAATPSQSFTRQSIGYAYDLQGRLAVVTSTTHNSSGNPTARERTTYDYDAMGTRVSAKHEIDANADGTYESSTTTEYLTDYNNFTGFSQTLRETTRDANGNLVKTITYALGQDEINQTVVTFDANGDVVSEETLVFGHDGHQSVRILTGLSGALSQFVGYDAYGQLLGVFSPAGALVSGGNGVVADASLVLTSLLYGGESFDSNINQLYLRARWYDASTGRFNQLDPFLGNSQDPQSFHKYLFTHADPINGSDPSGMMSLAGQLTVATISLTVASIALPFLGAAYLTATGKLNPYGVLDELTKVETWAAAAFGFGVGVGLSVGVQALLLKMGKEAAKKWNPVVGVGFAFVGFVESVKMTYRMVTEELPKEKTERYVAVLLAGAVLTAVAGGTVRYMASKGTGNDQKYWNMTAEEQRMYNVGQQLLPKKQWDMLGNLNPVGRGRVLTHEYSAAKRVWFQIKGFFEAARNQVTPGSQGMTVWQWISTGLTPELRFVFIESAFVDFAAIASGLVIRGEFE